MLAGLGEADVLRIHDDDPAVLSTEAFVKIAQSCRSDVPVHAVFSLEPRLADSTKDQTDEQEKEGGEEQKGGGAAPAAAGGNGGYSSRLIVTVKGTGEQAAPPQEQQQLNLLDRSSSSSALAAKPEGTLLGPADIDAILKEHDRAVAQRIEELGVALAGIVAGNGRLESDDGWLAGVSVEPAHDAVGFVGELEGRLALANFSSLAIIHAMTDAVDAVEDLLYGQLTAGLGKRITPDDFASFMEYDLRSLLKPSYRPVGFAQPVQPIGGSVQGLVSIEEWREGATAADVPSSAPLTTFVSRAMVPPDQPMSVSMGGTGEGPQFRFAGPQFLHAGVLHRFGAAPPPKINLHARARQFSRFILVLGRLGGMGGRVVEATDACVIQAKDDLVVPLLLEGIPATNPSRDAVQSLSAGQREFCESFRKMQLANSLFTVLIVQVGPQLEAVLNIPRGGLVREIKLQRDLMKLMCGSNGVPSDHLRYEEEGKEEEEEQGEGGDAEAAVRAVRGRVQEALEWIGDAKQGELDGEARVAERRALEAKLKFPVRIKLLTGRELSVHVSDASTVEALKELVQDREGIPPDAQRIIFKGKQLDPSTTMDQAGIQKGRRSGAAPLVHLILRLGHGASLAAGGGAEWEDAMQAAGSASSAGASGVACAGTSGSSPVADDGTVGAARDLASIPQVLDRALSEARVQASPTVVRPNLSWLLKSQPGLLTPEHETALDADGRRAKTREAFELLDVLTRSGELPLVAAELHAVTVVQQSFDLGLVETVIERNENPIVASQRCAAIVASTVHGCEVVGEVLSAEAR